METRKEIPHLPRRTRLSTLPELVPPRVKPVEGLAPKSPVPKPLVEADVDAGVAELPRVPKLSPTEGVLVYKKQNKKSIKASIYFGKIKKKTV